MTGAAGRRAIVIGGSIAGLFAAIRLRRSGWQASVFERSETALTGRGAGIVTHPELRDALRDIGIEVETGFGLEIRRRVVLDRDGTVVAERDRPQIATSWNRLYDLLREALPEDVVHLGRDLLRIEDSDDGVTAHFADGGRAHADLLVGADGFRSTVRRQYWPKVRPLYAGYVAWRGLVGEGDLVPLAGQDFFDSFAFSLPPGEQMLGYPVAGEGDDLRPGYRRYNVVWYRPADETRDLPGLLTDEAGRRHALSIPPPLIARRFVAQMRSAARSLLPPPFQTAVELAGTPFLQPIYDLETSAMAAGRVALIGDAAFVARPHVGAGVAKAVGDAVALADALERELEVLDALRRFGAGRLPVGRRIVGRARQLGAYLQSRFRTDEELAFAARHRSPEAVLAETAQLDFLQEPSG